jgi:hypothetical protein
VALVTIGPEVEVEAPAVEAYSTEDAILEVLFDCWGWRFRVMDPGPVKFTVVGSVDA